MTGIPSGREDLNSALCERDGATTPHFRTSQSAVSHPLVGHCEVGEKFARSLSRPASAPLKVDAMENESKFVKKSSNYDENTWALPMVNHLWTREEIDERLKNQPQYEPTSMVDKGIRFIVKKMLYRGFNYFSGFSYENPTPRSCAFRLIMLESIAGIPGMVAGVCRHFASLRTLRRDHGWIHTLLEEAQNERMHLMVCLKMFDAGPLTRLSVFLAQFFCVPILTAVYLVHPTAMHRFVGYLEETAVKTYTDLVRIVRTDGTELNKAWISVPASHLAKSYWNLDKDAMWVDVLEQMLADETHHRDVNHTFADMAQTDPNPFVEKNVEDLKAAANRQTIFVDLDPKEKQYTY
jgi:hypothetical protein